MSPRSGPASGGSLLQLLGSAATSNLHLASCHVGGSRSKVLKLPEGIGCLTPAGPPGFASVSLGGPGSSDAIFHYRVIAAVHSVSRQMAWADDVTLFYLSGTSVVEECYVGSEGDWNLVPSHFVSTGLVICEVHWPEHGTASIRVGEAPEVGVGIHFEEKSHATEISPRDIPESGGAASEISGGGFAPSQGIYCSFGSVSPVQGRSLISRVECISPSLTSSEVQIGFGLDPANPAFISTAQVYETELAENAVSRATSEPSGVVSVRDSLPAISNSPELSCQVGSQQGVVSSSSGPFSCLLPQAPQPGFESVLISRGGVRIRSEQHLFHDEPIVASNWPVTAVAGSSHIHVRGQNLNYVDSDSLLHGGLHRISSVYVLYIPWQEPLHGSVTTAFEANIVSGIVYTSDASIDTVSHTSGSNEGGTLVSISGTFPSNVICRFGALSGVPSRASLNSVDCVTSGHAAASVPVGVQIAGSLVGFPNLHEFTYVEAIDVQPPLVKEPVYGRSALALSGTSLVGVPFLCSYGVSESVPASVYHDKVECPLPLLPEGFSTLKIISTKMSQASEAFEFSLQAPARIERAEPASVAAPGGTIIWLHGENFPNKNPECRFGNSTTAAKFVSSRMIACEASSMELGVQKSVSFMSGTLSSAAGDTIALNSEDMPLIQNLEPKVGPARGGTLLQVSGKHFSSRVPLFCHFRSVLVEALFVSETEVLCTNPSDSPGSSVDVWVSSGADALSHFDFRSLFDYVNI